MRSLLAEVPAEMVARIKAGLLLLSLAEIGVLREAMKGGSDQDIATAVGLKVPTVGIHLRNIRKKTRCTRFELMRGVFELRDDPEVEAYVASPVRRLAGRVPRA